MTKDVIAAILERRSTRKFKSDKIPAATVGRLIDAARWAPSAGNIQAWRIIVVYNQEKKEQLVPAALGQKFLAQAPVVFVICALPEQSAKRYQERGRNLYVIQDTAAMVQNILLAAEGYGLGSCWMGAFDENAVNEVLELPKDYRPVAIIPIGYSDGERQAPARLAAEDMVKVIE